MQKSKIFFQIFIWTFLVNIREAKPTSQNSERMQRRAITGPIPDLYGPIADIPPTFSSAIEVRTWSRQFVVPFFRKKLNGKVHRTPKSDCSLFGVAELNRANSSNESFRTVRTLKSSSTVRTANAKNFHGLVELFAVFGSFENFWCLLFVMLFRKYWRSRRKVRSLQFGTRTANKFAENRHFHFVLELLGRHYRFGISLSGNNTDLDDKLAGIWRPTGFMVRRRSIWYVHESIFTFIDK